jgi:hypothetical protein
MVDGLVEGSSDLYITPAEATAAVDVKLLLILLMSEITRIDLNHEDVIFVLHLRSVLGFKLDLSFVFDFSIVMLTTDLLETGRDVVRQSEGVRILIVTRLEWSLEEGVLELVNFLLVLFMFSDSPASTLTLMVCVLKIC